MRARAAAAPAPAGSPCRFTVLLAVVTVVACEDPIAPISCGPIPRHTINVGETATVPVCFNDANEDAVTVSATSSNPAVATASVVASAVTVTAMSPGMATVSVTARDPGGLSGMVSFRVTVPNRAPRPVGTIAARTVVAGDTASLNVSGNFTEPDGQMLNYSASSPEPGVATISAVGSTVTVAAVSAGMVTVTVAATDPGGASATQSFQVTVPNRAPEAKGSIPAQKVQADSTATVDLSPYFTDPDGDALTYSASSSASGVASVTWSGSTVTIAAVNAGTATVRATANDPHGASATQSFEVTVPNRAPAARGSIPAQTVQAGDDAIVDLEPYFTDPDGDALTYSPAHGVTDTDVVWANVSGSVLTIHGRGVGATTITVTARDTGGLAASQSFQVTVPNRAPVARESIPAQTVQAGDDAIVDLEPHFTDPDGDALTYSGSSSDPAVATATVRGAMLTIRAVSSGTAAVTATATDPHGASGTQRFEVTVPNRAPVARGSIPAQTVQAGHDATVDLEPYFTDPDGDALTYSASSSDPAVATATAEGTMLTIRAVSSGTAAVTVTARDPEGLTATQWTTATINPPQRRIRLSAPVVYLTQVIQSAGGLVPLIAGRDALLRIFATGHEPSPYRPQVRAIFYLGGAIVHTAVMSLRAGSLPTEVDEGTLDRSFNSVIPGHLVQPGLGLVVELDTEGVIPLAIGSETRIPSTGIMDLGVVSVPKHIQTIVPVLISSAPDESILDWSRGLNADHHAMADARTLLPIGDMEVRVHEPFYTSSDLTTESGWHSFLREIRVVRQMEGGSGYYYGAVVLPRGSKWGGAGYIGLPVSVGENHPLTFAHELGHNMNLRHAPCGDAGAPDPAYPYRGGGIGVWGYDSHRAELVNPDQYKDLMGYCGPDWISDYHFIRALSHRRATESADKVSARHRTAPETTLLLWGAVGGGELLLEPAFLLEGPRKLPEVGGSYRLEGLGSDGSTRFAFSFAPDPVGHGGGQFLFAVPYDPARDGALERIVLSGPEGRFVLTPGSTRAMAIISNRTTGQVRAIVRAWSGGFNVVDGDTYIMVSDGLPGDAR